jgi:hypothetical protein
VVRPGPRWRSTDLELKDVNLVVSVVNGSP